ncbi:MAG: hypothetical protein ABIR67_15170 [Gaiellaceae bacterium]
MIPLAGGIALGLVWGWLLAQRFAEPPVGPAAASVAAVAAAALAGEAALSAPRGRMDLSDQIGEPGVADRPSAGRKQRVVRPRPGVVTPQSFNELPNIGRTQ